MPVIELLTNFTIDDEKDVALGLCKVASETLGKPENLMSVRVEGTKTLLFGGTFERAFALTITCMGGMEPERNEVHSRAFSTFLQDKLNLPSDRGFIHFIDPGLANMGFKGTTAAVLLR